jgi:hypothetical protein
VAVQVSWARPRSVIRRPTPNDTGTLQANRRDDQRVRDCFPARVLNIDVSHGPASSPARYSTGSAGPGADRRHQSMGAGRPDGRASARE